MTNEDKKTFLEELHLFKTEEANFAFLPTRLLLYQIDSDTYDKLADLVEKAGTDTPIDLSDEDLLSAGIIYEADEPLGDTFRKMVEAAEAEENEKETPKLRITNTVLQIANDCNLNCIYCYGDGG